MIQQTDINQAQREAELDLFGRMTVEYLKSRGLESVTKILDETDDAAASQLSSRRNLLELFNPDHEKIKYNLMK